MLRRLVNSIFHHNNFHQGGKNFSTERKLIKTIEKDGVKTIILNDPSSRHALSEAMMTEIYNEFECNFDEMKTHVVVITSPGPIFSAGHNLREINALGPAKSKEVFRKMTNVIKSIQCCPVPVIAKVDGLVTGAGCELVSSCDIVVCSDRSAFRMATIDNGLFGSTPAVPLTRVMPRMKAFYLLFTGYSLNADQANTAGLVSSVVPLEQLDKEIEKLCANFKNKSPVIIKMGKKFFYKQLEMEFWDAMELAEDFLVENLKVEDSKKLLKKFLEKKTTD